MKNQNFIFFILCICFLFLTNSSEAAVKTWTNTSGDFKWSTAANWSGNSVPSGGDDLVFNNGGAPYTITLVPTFTCTNILVDNNTSVTLKLIQLPEHAPGMYFISIQSLDGLIVKKVFIM